MTTVRYAHKQAHTQCLNCHFYENIQFWIKNIHILKCCITNNDERQELLVARLLKSRPSRVVGIATGYGLDGPGIESRRGARFSTAVQTSPGAHPASCTMSTGSFPGVKSGRGVTLTSQHRLVPWSRKGRAIPLLPLWAVRPVQSLSACTRVHFTFTFTIFYRPKNIQHNTYSGIRS